MTLLRPATHGQKIAEAGHEKSSRKQKAVKRTRKGSQPKRSSPRGLGSSGLKDGSSAPKSTATKWISKAITRGNSTNEKPLLPLSERRSNEEKQHSRDRRETETDKWEVTPDGSSAGREGRQFTVSNVGNNGRIYLRYDGARHVPLACYLALENKGGEGHPSDEVSLLFPELAAATAHVYECWNADMEILGLAFVLATNGSRSQTLLSQ